MSVELGVQWEPNGEHGVLVVDETGEARFQLDAHFDDIDQRLVVIDGLLEGGAHGAAQ